MIYSRMIGKNIKMELSDRGLSPDVLKPLGYSDAQISKLIEGRLILMREDIRNIAEILQVPAEELERSRGYDAYNNLVHNMGHCNNEEDQEFIFDIFDMYADLKEVVINHKN